MGKKKKKKKKCSLRGWDFTKSCKHSLWVKRHSGPAAGLPKILSLDSKNRSHCPEKTKVFSRKKEHLPIRRDDSSRFKLVYRVFGGGNRGNRTLERFLLEKSMERRGNPCSERKLTNS